MSAGEGGRLRVLLLNWQDRENPQAGGAEVHLHEIFGRLAGRGNEVRAVVAGWPGAAPRARVDGIELTRVGGRHTYPWRAPRAARALLRDRPADVVVEDINKLPLLSPLWAGRPVVALVPHLFGTTVFREASWPVAAAVWGAERAIPPVYRRCAFQAISESTADDLAGRGIDRRRITVIPPGIDHARYRPGDSDARAGEPLLVYVGRLKRYKGLDVLFSALRMLGSRTTPPTLIVAGRGDDRARLERAAASQGMAGHVRFVGFVEESEKIELLRRAWALVYPSPKEGWGITVVEAAACGTPVIASDAPGLRESVAPGGSGVLVPHDSPESWAEAIARVIEDPALRERLGHGGMEHARRFSWDRAADETEAHLRQVVETRA